MPLLGPGSLCGWPFCPVSLYELLTSRAPNPALLCIQGKFWSSASTWLTEWFLLEEDCTRAPPESESPHAAPRPHKLRSLRNYMLLPGLEAYGWAWALLFRKADDWAAAWERWRLHGTGETGQCFRWHFLRIGYARSRSAC